MQVVIRMDLIKIQKSHNRLQFVYHDKCRGEDEAQARIAEFRHRCDIPIFCVPNAIGRDYSHQELYNIASRLHLVV